MDIFEFALKMEQNGKTLYEKLAQTASNKGLQTIFNALAQDEQKHYETLMAMQARQKVEMAESKVLENSRDIFASLLSGQGAKSPSTDDLAGYRYAMKLEAESFRLYEEAASKEDKSETQAILLRMAAEEHKHFTILENVYSFVNAPSQYLAWAEFSNLEEFRNFGRDVGY